MARDVTVVLGGLLVALVAGEIGLRVLDRPGTYTSGWRSWHSPKEELNQLGFRGRPIEYEDSDLVILLVGDSNVEALASDHHEMPERLLEHHLRELGLPARVFTVGCSGYGQDQELLALLEYRERFRVDHIILWQTIDNDVWNNMFPTHWPTNGFPKPTYRFEDGRLVGPNHGMGEQVTPSFKLAALVNRFLMTKPDDRWERDHLPPAYEPMTAWDGPVDTSWQERWDVNLGLMQWENLDNEKSHLSVLLTPRSPRMEYGIQLTRALLQEIRALVEPEGIFLIVGPDRVTDRFEGERVYSLNGKYYRTSWAEQDETFARIHEGMNKASFPIRIEDWRVSEEDGHLNQEAMDLFLKDVAGHFAAILMGRVIHAAPPISFVESEDDG